ILRAQSLRGHMGRSFSTCDGHTTTIAKPARPMAGRQVFWLRPLASARDSTSRSVCCREMLIISDLSSAVLPRRSALSGANIWLFILVLALRPNLIALLKATNARLLYP